MGQEGCSGRGSRALNRLIPITRLGSNHGDALPLAGGHEGPPDPAGRCQRCYRGVSRAQWGPTRTGSRGLGTQPAAHPISQQAQAAAAVRTPATTVAAEKPKLPSDTGNMAAASCPCPGAAYGQGERWSLCRGLS